MLLVCHNCEQCIALAIEELEEALIHAGNAKKQSSDFHHKELIQEFIDSLLDARIELKAALL